MPKITMEEQPEFAVLPDDSIVHLKIEDLKVKDVEGQHGPWQKLEFTFKILGIQAVGDGSNPEDYESLITSKIWGSVPFKLTDNPENKLRQWAEAILDMPLSVGFELDTDFFFNREVRGVTNTYDKKAKDPRTGLPFKGHQINSLLPKSGGPAVAQAQPAAQQAPPAQNNPWLSPAQQPQTVPGDPWGNDPDF